MYKLWYVVTICSNNIINWTGVLKKEARGINDAALREVQEVRSDIVITKTDFVDKEVSAISKDLVDTMVTNYGLK